MSAVPALASDYQIGVDNALIQVPQNYTVPANPPSEPNPPSSTLQSTKNAQTTTTKDSVTIYVSAIKGFNNPLTMSFFIKKIDTTVDPNLSPADATTVPTDGAPLPILIGSTHLNWVQGVWDGTNEGWKATLPFMLTPNVSNSLNTYVATNFQTLWINPQNTGGKISPNHPPSYQVNIYAHDPLTNSFAACSFTLVVSQSAAQYGLGVYEVTHNPTPTIPTQSTFVNADSNNGTFNLYVDNVQGFMIDQTIEIGRGTPRDEINSVTGVFADHIVLFGALLFTHTASEADSVLGYQTQIFTNKVSLSASAAPPNVQLGFQYYPLEPTYSQPADIHISFKIPSDIHSIINQATSTINGTPLNTFVDFVIPAGTYTRDTPFASDLIPVYIELTGAAAGYRALFELIGTDNNGVTATAYTIIEVTP